MIQVLQTGDGTLPPGLTVQNTYNELRKGNKKAVIVVCNNTAYPKTLRKKKPCGQGISCIASAGIPQIQGDCGKGLVNLLIPIPLS